jgi:hypothetical protein
MLCPCSCPGPSWPQGVQGYVRPGCTELVVDIFFAGAPPPGAGVQGSRTAATMLHDSACGSGYSAAGASLLSASSECPPWRVFRVFT